MGGKYGLSYETLYFEKDNNVRKYVYSEIRRLILEANELVRKNYSD